MIEIVKSSASGGNSAEGVDETSATRIGLGEAPDPSVADATALIVPKFAPTDAASEAADLISVTSQTNLPRLSKQWEDVARELLVLIPQALQS